MIHNTTVAPQRRRRQPRPQFTVGQQVTICNQPWGGNIIAATIERITPSTYHLRTATGLKIILAGEFPRRIRESK